MKKSASVSNYRVLKWIVGIILLSIIYIVIKGLFQPENHAPLLTENYTVDTVILGSKVLNEKREIIIYKPIKFEKEDSVVVIYILDGEYSIYRINSIAKEQFDKPVIGIGVVNTDRRRDMLPDNQPDKFLEFINSELIPEIETEFLIDQRILFGHSNAGGFTVYSMINEPTLFDKYIASSPTPITNIMDDNVYKQLESNNIKFYFSYGSKDKKRVKEWSKGLHDDLQKIKFDHFEWKNEIYEGEDHNSSASISLIKGLQY